MVRKRGVFLQLVELAGRYLRQRVLLPLDDMGLQRRVEFVVADARRQRAEPGEQRGQQCRDRHADLEALEIVDAVELPARRRRDLPETVVPDLLHWNNAGLADGVADDLTD